MWEYLKNLLEYIIAFGWWLIVHFEYYLYYLTFLKKKRQKNSLCRGLCYPQISEKIEFLYKQKVGIFNFNLFCSRAFHGMFLKFTIFYEDLKKIKRRFNIFLVKSESVFYRWLRVPETILFPILLDLTQLCTNF